MNRTVQLGAACLGLTMVLLVGTGTAAGQDAPGAIVAWGWNVCGQCMVRAPNSGFVAVAGGGYHRLAVSAARRCFVAGDFQGWDPAADPLTETPPPGSRVWARSYSGVTPGAR